jgi:hypothetical protein
VSRSTYIYILTDKITYLSKCTLPGVRFIGTVKTEAINYARQNNLTDKECDLIRVRDGYGFASKLTVLENWYNPCEHTYTRPNNLGHMYCPSCQHVLY